MSRSGPWAASLNYTVIGMMPRGNANHKGRHSSVWHPAEDRFAAGAAYGRMGEPFAAGAGLEAAPGCSADAAAAGLPATSRVFSGAAWLAP